MMRLLVVGLFCVLVSFCAAESNEDIFLSEVQQQNVHRVSAMLEQEPKLADLRFGEEKNSPLHFAAQSGNAELLREILKVTQNVNVQNTKGETPIHSAIINDHPDCVRILLGYEYVYCVGMESFLTFL